MRNLRYFSNLLFGKVILFQVDTALVMSDVVLQPAPKDLYNIILGSIHEFLQM
jgi:hypothetical protein